MVSKNQKVRSFIVRSFLGLSDDNAELLALLHDDLYELGNIIKQQDEEMFDLIIRTFADTLSTEKIKVELNRTRRSLNNEW